VAAPALAKVDPPRITPMRLANGAP